MDIHVEFRLASRYQAAELFQCFYLPSGVDEAHPNGKIPPEDGHANRLLNGHADSSEKSTTLNFIPVEGSEGAEKPAFTGSSHKNRAPNLSLAKVQAMGKEFANKLPEREFSMASLQGYLMAYKTRPIEAVADFQMWLEKERKDKAEKARRRNDKAMAVQPPPVTPIEVVASPAKEDVGTGNGNAKIEVSA